MGGRATAVAAHDRLRLKAGCWVAPRASRRRLSQRLEGPATRLFALDNLRIALLAGTGVRARPCVFSGLPTTVGSVDPSPPVAAATFGWIPPHAGFPPEENG